MCLYFHANPDYAKIRQPHKKFTIMWIHDLVQQLLDRIEQNDVVELTLLPHKQEEWSQML